LGQALQDSDPGVRWQAIRALNAAGSAQDLPALEPLLNDNTEVFGTSIADATRHAIEAIQHRRPSGD